MLRRVPKDKSVALVADSLVGGMGAAVLAEASYLNQHGWRVCVLAPEAESLARLSLPSRDSRVTFRSVAFPDATRSAISGLRAGYSACQFLKADNAHVIHSHGLRSSLFTRLWNHSVPQAMTYHGGTVSTGFRRRTMTTLARTMSAAFSASPGALPGFVFLPHASPEIFGRPRIPVIRNEGHSLHVGWFARLEPPKRPDIWQEILREAVESGLAVVGHVFGTGSLSRTLGQFQADMPVEIVMHGSTPPNIAMDIIDVLLAWSDSDALSFAIQEAIWSGVPVLSNNISGPAFLLSDSSVGITDRSSVLRDLAKLASPEQRLQVAAQQQRCLLNILEPHAPWKEVEGVLERIAFV